MALLLLALACTPPEAPPPTGPMVATLGPLQERPGSTRWMSGGRRLLDTPLGLLVIGGWGSKLVRPDGTVEAHRALAEAARAGVDGTVELQDPHGPLRYDLRTRVLVEGGLLAADFATPRDTEVEVDSPRGTADVTVRIRRAGTVVTGRMDLPEPGMRHQFTVLGGGHAWLSFAPKWLDATGRLRWPTRPHVVIAVSLETGREARAERWNLPDQPRVTSLPENGAYTAVWTPEGLLVGMGGDAGTLRAGRWTRELVGVAHLHVDRAGTVWAVGDRLWRRIPAVPAVAGAAGHAARWEVVLDGIPVSDGEIVDDLVLADGDARFRYDPVTGAFAREPATSGDAARPARPETYRTGPPTAAPTLGGALPADTRNHDPLLVHVASDGATSLARGSLSALWYPRWIRGPGALLTDEARFVDDGRMCGQSLHPWGFVTLLGDCEDWIGLTSLGAVLAGAARVTGNDEGRAVAAPVGTAQTLARDGDRVVVGGTEAIAVGRAHGGAVDDWVRLPVDAPVTHVATWPGQPVWYAAGGEVCRWQPPAAPACSTLPRQDARSVPDLVLGLAAGPTSAVVVTVDDVLRVEADGHLVDYVGAGDIHAVYADPARGVYWLSRYDALVALDLVTGAPRGRVPIALTDGLFRLGDDGAGGLRLHGGLVETGWRTLEITGLGGVD